MIIETVSGNKINLPLQHPWKMNVVPDAPAPNKNKRYALYVIFANNNFRIHGGTEHECQELADEIVDNLVIGESRFEVGVWLVKQLELYVRSVALGLARKIQVD